MSVDINHVQHTAADTPPQIVVVQEAERRLSNWEMLRGVVVTAISGVIGGAIGMVVGGLGDKGEEEKLTVYLDWMRTEAKRKWPIQLGGQASKIGGIMLAGISLLLAGSANFDPSRKASAMDGKTLDTPVPARDAKPETLHIPKSSVIALPAAYEGQMQAGQVRQHQAM